METRDQRASAGSAAPSSKGATSTVQSVFHRQVLPGRAFAASIWREPATEFAALPPRSRLPTLLRPLPLSRWRARPKPNQGLLTHDRRGPRAACRFLQPIRPTSTTAQSSKPRPPRPWSPTCAAVRYPRTWVRETFHEPGSVNIPRTWVREHSTYLGSWNGARVAVLRGTANRDFTGQGPARACAFARLPPPRSLAVEASPQPDRLEHLMSRARDDTGRSCLHRRSAPNGTPCLRARQRAPLAQDPPLGSPHASSREGDHDPPHPRCLPPPDHPVRGWSLSHKLSPACGLETGRLFDLTQWQPVTGMQSVSTRVRWSYQLESR